MFIKVFLRKGLFVVHLVLNILQGSVYLIDYSALLQPLQIWVENFSS